MLSLKTILLMMWDKMAEISFKHLRPNDFIYVSGQLQCYEKDDKSGELRTNYQVTVKELNYVARNCQGQTRKTSEKFETKEEADMEKKNQDRLYLWQLFFASPYEWWDKRQKKVNPRAPDFRHKDTGECLWLNRDDPPWVKRQLQLHDSRMAECGQRKHVSSQSRMSMWV
ncbi:hypothetical protein HHK36_030881 [Tetracentron sinense]|uniref:Uncharacterized protein n=1 Tax=Tetracentron sinense TaxID=13715 RepID=A0A835CZ46_TETSI|nr:hypothetical protein HHK36_030881 [Tetracentron sinense]